MSFETSSCLHDLVAAQAARTPDAIAVTYAGQHLSYAALDQRANQLAHLLQAQGVGPEVRVGVYLERSLELVIAVLGVLKAGGAYVPLDPAYPPARLAFMLADAQVPLLVTQSRLLLELPAAVPTVCMDTDYAKLRAARDDSPITEVRSHNLAYVIYTSGSTGRPKGVMIAHEAILSSLLWMQATYPMTEADRFLQVFSFSFDASVWEIFGPLIVGARIVMTVPGGQQDSRYLVRIIADEQVTRIQLVPSLLRVLLEEPEINRCTSLRNVFCGGEALPVELRDRFFTRLSADLCNLYGPTETAIWGTFCPCEPENSRPIVPIGRPIGSAQIYLLDPYLQLVAAGVPGELYRGGHGLAWGYLNRPDMTAERFVPDPFSGEAGARLYRTGDLARYLLSGEIEYLGRIDHQVKLRGFRIELGEVEWALNQHPAIQTSVVMAREDVRGDKRLVAYVLPNPDSRLPLRELRTFMQARLPEFMVPSTFIWLDALPLTPNGKIDRNALPAPDAARPEITSFTAPRSAVEMVLADIWADLLQLDYVGVEDNFFALGGHSLLATQVMTRVCDQFQVEIPLRTLFQAPTVTELAAMILSDSSRRARIERTAELLIQIAKLPDDRVERILYQAAPSSDLDNAHESKAAE